MSASADTEEVEIDPSLVDEIAAEHVLDRDRLRAAMAEALDAYLTEADFRTWRAHPTNCVDDVRRMLTPLRRARQYWLDLSPGTRDEVAYFQSPGGPDPVAPPLEFLIDLLEEYVEHYGRPRGNPGKARDGEARELRSLEAFAGILMWFWIGETGRPFGHVVERADDVDGFDPEKELAPREAVSDGIDFLISASQCLPHRYSNANFETIVRALKCELSAGT